ncbi:MAG: tetratricopeptide repeat protein, partial [Candidatus Thiodiazotropha sp.]
MSKYDSDDQQIPVRQTALINHYSKINMLKNHCRFCRNIISLFVVIIASGCSTLPPDSDEIKNVNNEATEKITYTRDELLGRATVERNLGNYAKAIEILAPIAESGDAIAQFILGNIFDVDTSNNEHEAIKWYRKSAKQGLAEAQNALGVMYAIGNGVTRDDKIAVNWYLKAAEQGYAEAQFNLGSRYERGLGVDQDYATARAWYAKAVSSNHPKSIHNLAILYVAGRGGEKDTALAMELFLKAAKFGSPDSHYEIGVLYNKGIGVPKDQQIAAQWFLSGAKLGSAHAQVALGNLFWYGEGLEKNL